MSSLVVILHTVYSTVDRSRQYGAVQYSWPYSTVQYSTVHSAVKLTVLSSQCQVQLYKYYKLPYCCIIHFLNCCFSAVFLSYMVTVTGNYSRFFRWIVHVADFSGGPVMHIYTIENQQQALKWLSEKCCIVETYVKNVRMLFMLLVVRKLCNY